MGNGNTYKRKRFADDCDGSETSAGAMLIAASALTIPLGIVGGYIGNACGWLSGEIVQRLPYLSEAIPNYIRSSGDTPGSNATVDAFRAIGTYLGFATGARAPWVVLNKKLKDD